MWHIIRPGTKFDFLGKAPIFSKVSIAVFIGAVAVILIKGLNLGLDFRGGHEILIEFPTEVSVADTRGVLRKLYPEVDTSVQSYEVPTSSSTFRLCRIEQSEAFGKKEIKALNDAFTAKYGDQIKPVRYNPETGDRVEVQFVENATTAGGVVINEGDLRSVVVGTKHDVRDVRAIGRPEQLRFEVLLQGAEFTILEAMKKLDPEAKTAKVEFVGPTVGKQLRDDGLLAVLYALLCILIYIALRFDFFYSPGAILCLFHDAVITVAILTLIGAEFSLATIAGLLTLVGYSINDTIVVFDRIRETVGKVQGTALKEVLNRAINETLGRTLMTSISTMLACLSLMFFGRGTVLASFGLIMAIGIIIGTYSSIYVASPVFMILRERFGPKQLQVEESKKKPKKKGGPAASPA